MTRQELDAHVASLKSVGGVYDYVALAVEHLNAPHLERETA
ncbi:hypothetical protein M2118_000456 [Aurantimicrobium minutum]|nr:hypothetical protein [Aurantimicrobium minutum]